MLQGLFSVAGGGAEMMGNYDEEIKQREIFC